MQKYAAPFYFEGEAGFTNFKFETTGWKRVAPSQEITEECDALSKIDDQLRAI